MIDKTLRALILLTATIGLMQSGRLGAGPLPSRALTRIGDHRLYHGPGVGCAALSPDGRRIASAAYYGDADSKYLTGKDQEDYNRVIVLWDALSGERLRELRVRDFVSCLVFSPDGKCLSVACDSYNEKSEVVVFAVETGKILRRLENFKNHISDLQCSLDGKQLHISEERGPVSAWDAASGKQLHLWKPPPEETSVGNKEKLRGLHGLVSPDGKFVAWEMGYRDETRGANAWTAIVLSVYDAANDKLLYRKNAKPEQSLERVVFSADGKQLVVDCGNKLLVWDAATGKRRGSSEAWSRDRFALTPDGRRAIYYPDDPFPSDNHKLSLQLWDVANEKPSRQFSIDYVRLYDHGDYEPLARPQAFSADGKTLLLAISPTLRLLDTTTGKELFHSHHLSPVTPRFSTDGRTLFTSCYARRCRWDIFGKQPALLAEEQRKAWDFGYAYSAGGRLLMGESETKVLLRETKTGRILRPLEGAFVHAPLYGGDRPFGLFSADESRVLYRNNGIGLQNLRVYEVKTGKASVEIDGENTQGEPVFTPDGRYVAWADRDRDIVLYDAATGKVVRTLRSTKPLPENDSSYPHLCFSLDGDRLIVTEHGSLEEDGYRQLPTRVFQVSRSREILRFYANPEKTNQAAQISCMVCSPNGRLLAVAEKFSGTIRLIELASGKVRAEFAGHRHGVHGLDFAPDGKTLASGGEDHVVFLWDVTGAKTLAATKTNLPAWWNDLASDDGKRAGIAIASFLLKEDASLAFLQEKLRPEEATSEKRLSQLIRDLDANTYETREAASRELIRLGERAEAALRRELTNRPTLEVRRRIEDVLSKLEPSPLPPETLRTLRAIEVLEHIGTAAARRCLETLAKGAADARQTREAKTVLQRLTNRQRRLPGGANPQAHPVESR